MASNFFYSYPEQRLLQKLNSKVLFTYWLLKDCINGVFISVLSHLVETIGEIWDKEKIPSKQYVSYHVSKPKNGPLSINIQKNLFYVPHINVFKMAILNERESKS